MLSAAGVLAYSSSLCNQYRLGDGECDSRNNNEECGMYYIRGVASEISGSSEPFFLSFFLVGGNVCDYRHNLMVCGMENLNSAQGG